MIDDIDIFLKGEDVSHDPQVPTIGTIKNVVRVKKEDLKFKSAKDKYQLAIEISGLVYKMFANNTSMKSLMRGLGPDETTWAESDITIFSQKQKIDKEDKWVIFVEPISKVE